MAVRWVCTVAFVCKLFEKFPAWLKFFFVIQAIIFNPISPLRFDREFWAVLDIIAAGTVFCSEIMVIKRALKNGSAQKR
jgi:hypothetical protein